MGGGNGNEENRLGQTEKGYKRTRVNNGKSEC